MRTFFVWLLLLGTGLAGGRAAAQVPSFKSGPACSVNSIINVKCPPYGAKGDGSTNDYAAISTAITAAQAVNGCVTFPASANPYLFNTPIVITGTVCILGGPAILTYGGGATTTAFTMTATGSTFAEKSLVRDITVNAAGLATNAIILKQVFNSTFQNLSATNAVTDGILCQQCQLDLFLHPTVSNNVSGTYTTIPVNGFVLDRSATTSGQSSANTLIDPVMEGVSGAGLQGLNAAVSTTVTGGTLEGNGVGADLVSALEWTFNAVDIEVNSTMDIRLGAAAANNTFVGQVGAPNVQLISGSFDNLFTGGVYNQITINAGSTLNRIIAVSVNGRNTGGLTDNGTGTVAFYNTNDFTGLAIPDLSPTFTCNLVLQSEAFATAPWTAVGSGGSVAANNAGIAPDGNNTASSLLATSVINGSHLALQTGLTVPAGATTVTFSVFAKQNVNTKRILLRETTQTGASSSFDLSTGVYLAGAVGGTGTISAYPNGWYRVTLTATLAAGATSFGIYLLPNAGTVFADATYVAAIGDGFLLWGGELVTGALPGSYIKTTTVSVCSLPPAVPLQVNGGVQGNFFQTTTNCSSSASPAVCGSAAAGSVAIPLVTGVEVVNTTAVTANSQILLMFDSSLGTKLGITCNTVEPGLYGVTARTPGTSFTITSSIPITNAICMSYVIIN